jgi:hypothetical protein
VAGRAPRSQQAEAGFGRGSMNRDSGCAKMVEWRPRAGAIRRFKAGRMHKDAICKNKPIKCSKSAGFFVQWKCQSAAHTSNSMNRMQMTRGEQSPSAWKIEKTNPLNARNVRVFYESGDQGCGEQSGRPHRRNEATRIAASLSEIDETKPKDPRYC